MFINLSNHPALDKKIILWDDKQYQAARAYGEVVDLPFPDVKPEWDTQEVYVCALEYFNKCKEAIGINKSSSAIHIAGEQVFCFLLAQMLLKEGYCCLLSTTERIANMKGEVKTCRFEFKRFREYKLL